MKLLLCRTALLVILLIAALGLSQSRAQFYVRNLKTENRTNPLGINARQPRYSWLLVGEGRGLLQTAYEIRVLEGKKLVWETGKVNSDSSTQVAYRGPTLVSGQRYDWKVRVWDNKGQVSGWSDPAWWQMGLLDTSQWKAEWISPGYEEPAASRPSPLFRKEFIVAKKIRSAFAYITAHGLYEARINGHRVGDAYLTPGWTSYHSRLQYQVYDVTALIRQGTNAIGAMLGSGWWRGFIAFDGEHEFYGKDISLLVQVVITYADATAQVIGTDRTWKTSTGKVLTSEIYNGEKVDDRLEKTGWDFPGYNDKNWPLARTEDFSLNNLIVTENEPVRKQEVFKPVRIFTDPKGGQVIDFGQDLVGWVEMTVRGVSGRQVVLSHGEVLDKTGNFFNANLRAARAQDTFILRGGEPEHFEPHFTWHGFRYVRVEGYPGPLDPKDFKAVALYSDLENTGSFSCSDTLVNQLQHNIQWGQKGNFIEVPTDCPQRDERLGWTGDAQVFSRTAMFNRGVESFFTKWLKDLSADQWPDGTVSSVVPDVLGIGPRNGGSAGWGEAATVIPWNLWLAYGDKQVLEDQYASMKRWVDAMHARSVDDLWDTTFHYGDWLFFSPDDDHWGRSANTDKYYIAQCFYAYSTSILVKAAKVLGKIDDAEFYSRRLAKIKTIFLHQYITPAGLPVSNTQTAYVLALAFDMLPDSMRAKAAARLVENIHRYKDHLTTGFLGTPYICEVLTRFGYLDVAYKLLLQDSYPSWLYPVKMGATTIWERWNGLLPDGTPYPGTMNSFNHYAYGAIGEWMYEVVAGIDTYEDGPGYKHSRIQPQPGGHLTHAEADLETPYGLLSSHWRLEGDSLALDVVIPPNTRSEVFVPAAGGATHYSLGSGTYHFKTQQDVNK